MTSVTASNAFYCLPVIGGGLRSSCSASTTSVKPPEYHSQHVCIRSILRVLLAMIDGPYMDWKPTIADWNRIKVGSVLYVDQDGLLSPKENNLRFGGSGGYDRDTSRNPEFSGETHPPGGQMGSADPRVIREMARMDGPAGYGAIQPGDMPPSDLSANLPYFHEGSGMSSSSGFSGPGGTSEAVRTSGGTNGVYIPEHSSSMLPMGLMIYNDLMMDIKGTAGFLGQEFQDSVLFGPTPTRAGQYLDQGSEPQPPNTAHGWVLPSISLFRRRR